MKQIYLFSILFFSVHQLLHAQSAGFHQAYVEVGALASSTDRTPFWLRANQFGTVPYSTPIGSLRVGAKGTVVLSDTLGKAPDRAWRLTYGAEAIGNAGKQNQLLAPEYYISLTHRQIEFVVGRRREVIGLVDTTLTSGSYSWSGNALPIPKVQFGTRGFAPLGRKQWLAINAFMAHGWFANTEYMQHSFLHQKSVIFRIGKPSATVRGYVGINHSVQWGGHSDYLDYHYAVDGQLPGELRDFPNVFLAIRTNGLNNPRITSFDYTNLYGNHVGSIDLGVEVRLPSANLMLYHQHSYEDASGVFFKNAPDGLTGLRIRPVRSGSSGFHVDDFLIEFLSTLDQGGPIFEPWNGLSGNDNYFNNGQYQEGWAYKNRIIGTPFITLKDDVLPEYVYPSSLAVNNNRVQVAHLAMRAGVGRRISLLAKVSYSRNMGTYGILFSNKPKQLSSVIQLGMPLNWLDGLSLTASVAADIGQLYTNTIGGYVGLRKTVWRR
ncbi:capsule assembly Wzi family protein [Spirosoma aerolatum]|uniref:capsule assembly Wzi family protein n=1 Tax=Spirosoma aerolatum TaxID=1211326 RepID=UPI0009AE0129|nr:capsule assembly Wzi family protein [Spirosoma aerolatum]